MKKKLAEFKQIIQRSTQLDKLQKSKITQKTSAEYYIFSDILVSVGSNLFIYKGILNEFYLTKEGDLEIIILSNTEREKFENNNEIAPTIQPQRYEIPGNYVIIPYAQVLNINIRFEGEIVVNIEDSEWEAIKETLLKNKPEDNTQPSIKLLPEKII